MASAQKQGTNPLKTYPSKPKFLVLEHCMTAAGYQMVERREAHIVQHGGKNTVKLLARITRSIDDRAIATKIRKDGPREDRSQKTALDDEGREKFYRDWEMLWIPTLPDDKELSPTMLIIATLEPFDISYPGRKSALPSPSTSSSYKGLQEGTKPRTRSKSQSQSRRVKMVSQPSRGEGRSASLRDRAGSSVRPVEQEEGGGEEEEAPDALETTSPEDRKVSQRKIVDDFFRESEAREQSARAKTMSRKSKIKDFLEQTKTGSSGGGGGGSGGGQSPAGSGPPPGESGSRVGRGGGAGTDTLSELKRIVKDEISQSNEELIESFRRELRQNGESQERRLKSLRESLRREMEDLRSHSGDASTKKAARGDETCSEILDAKAGEDPAPGEGAERRESCICEKYHLFGKSHRCPHGRLPELSTTSTGRIKIPPLPPRTTRLEDDAKFAWLFEPPKRSTRNQNN